MEPRDRSQKNKYGMGVRTTSELLIAIMVSTRGEPAAFLNPYIAGELKPGDDYYTPMPHMLKLYLLFIKDANDRVDEADCQNLPCLHQAIQLTEEIVTDMFSENVPNIGQIICLRDIMASQLAYLEEWRERLREQDEAGQDSPN